MIYLRKLIFEGSAVPGALEGWLDTSGNCHYVKYTHTEWAANYFREPAPDESDIGSYEAKRIDLLKRLYSRGWSRIVIFHDKNLIYFDTFNTPWKSLSKLQRQWLYDAATHGVEVRGEKIIIDTSKMKEVPYKLQFGNDPHGHINPEDISQL